jgi:polyphosphate kinase
LQDGVDAWDLQADGHYRRVQPLPHHVAHGAQAALMQRYSDVGGA